MKSQVKVLAAVFVGLAVVGAITVLAIKYFEVITRVFEDVKGHFGIRKPFLFGDPCCDCDYDDDSDDFE